MRACQARASRRLLADRRWRGLLTRTPMTGHSVPAVVALGQVIVVGATHQPDVLHAVLTAKAEWVPMVELELVAFLTPSSLLIHVAASAAVALPYGTPDGRRDVA